MGSEEAQEAPVTKSSEDFTEAAQRAAQGMTASLRQYAEHMGWSRSAAASLRVKYADSHFTVSGSTAAGDAEYGSASGSSPKPAIRTFDSKHLGDPYVIEALDGLLEVTL